MLTDLPPSEFWEMTFRELSIFIESYYKKKEAEYKQSITAAWYCAALSRTNRMPRLEQLFKKQQSPDEMLDTIKRFYARRKAE